MTKLLPCAWFAMCTNETDKVADHPVLGPIPCCDRCAEVVGMENRIRWDGFPHIGDDSGRSKFIGP